MLFALRSSVANVAGNAIIVIMGSSCELEDVSVSGCLCLGVHVQDAGSKLLARRSSIEGSRWSNLDICGGAHRLQHERVQGGEWRAGAWAWQPPDSQGQQA